MAGMLPAGFFATVIAATIIKFCPEGSSPLVADLVMRAAAPGNGFVFPSGGVATDYAEMMSLKDTKQSWKLALMLPAMPLPRIDGWCLD